LTGDRRLEVVPESLASAGTGLGRVAGDLGAALVLLQQVLDATGSPWGGDEVGGPFGAEYGPLLRQALAAITSYQGQVDYAATELAAAAALLAGTDDLNAELLARLKAAWPAPPGDGPR